MTQNFTPLPSTEFLSASLTPLQDRDDAAASCFSGTAFPSANLLLGQLCYRTDELKLYQLTNTSPVTWTLVYDLSTGTVTAPVATAVAWSGISGTPTSVAGYGISDALKKTGDTASGKIVFAASGTGAASINVPPGTAPSSPVNGDMWTTTAAMLIRINGNTRTVSVLEAAETYAAKKTFATGGTGSASANIPAGAAPTSPVDGDLWATSSQLVYRMAGVSRNVAFWDASSRVAVANGGTGASDAAGARTNLGLGTAATRNISVGTTAPSSPATNDLWVDTN